LLIEAKYRDGILNDLRSGLVILLTSAFFLISGITNPSYNWDIVAYVAAAYHLDGLSGKELSSATYNELKREADANTFKELTEGDYVDVVFKDPASLEQQLPFYTIKAAYIQLMRIFETLGVSYTRSTYIISAIFTSASVLVTALFLLHFGVPILWLPVAATVAGYGTIASYSTPDAIACFFALLLIYFFIKGSKASYVISALLPLVRTDLAILSLLTMGFDFYRKRSIYPILSAAAALAVYVIINKIAGNYGWLALFNFTFIKITPYPKEMQISDDIGAYLQAYAAGVRNFISSRHIMIYVLVLFIFVFRRGHKKLTPEINAIMMICLLYASAHFALFPVYEDRFFAFPASLLFLSLIVLLFYSGSVSLARQAG
jgi:hypothetical protein